MNPVGTSLKPNQVKASKPDDATNQQLEKVARESGILLVFLPLRLDPENEVSLNFPNVDDPSTVPGFPKFV